MYSAFELVKLSEASKENFAHAASQIFYKITKNHREPDGNKRSAIICLTVFAILNKKKLNISPDLLEFLALLTAGHPAIIREYVLSLLEDVFEERIHDR